MSNEPKILYLVLDWFSSLIIYLCFSSYRGAGLPDGGSSRGGTTAARVRLARRGIPRTRARQHGMAVGARRHQGEDEGRGSAHGWGERTAREGSMREKRRPQRCSRKTERRERKRTEMIPKNTIDQSPTRGIFDIPAAFVWTQVFGSRQAMLNDSTRIGFAASRAKTISR